MEKLKPLIIEELQSLIAPRSIYEKSLLPTRKSEGLLPHAGLLWGEAIQPVEVLENGLKFVVDIADGQKTGFFCDHREMRSKVRSLSQGKRVLNCFAYSGGFSVYALAGGATAVDSVDLSAAAIAQAKENVALNGFEVEPQAFHVTDVFEFLRTQNLDYDLVILDPPAFAKKQKDIVAACRGYKDINRVAMQKMPAGSWLLTCSCSHHVDEALFQKVLFQASVEAGRKVRIASRHIMAADHPISLCHPESEYLKSFLLFVE
jgi:23S rRNA (cytosine1962-C5)-methyltransferase